MSAVLAALFADHETAESVRTRLVSDGFPTDRVELTSRRELGQAAIVPAEPTSEKLCQHFGKIFQNESDQRSARLLSHGVLEGRAVIAVQPRSELETQRAFEILQQGGPVELRERDLDDQTMEHATAASETPVIVRIGKVLIGQQH